MIFPWAKVIFVIVMLVALFLLVSAASAFILDGKRIANPSALPRPVVISKDMGGVDSAKDKGASFTFLKHVRCRGPHLDVCPGFLSDCSRVVLDHKFHISDIQALHDIAAKGMGTRKKVGGPTILDINTGFLRDSEGLVNLFSESSTPEKDAILTADDFEVYGRIIKQLKDLVIDVFQYKGIHFTAPTFITRLDGSTNWDPKEIHDEYWHRHADHNNTDHYHFSGLLYMSEYQKDFEGGRLLFYGDDDDNEPHEIVEPKPGRVAIFSSGAENTHRVERVTSGERFVLAFWFTCDESKEFEIFLDGQAHLEFSGKLGNQLRRKEAAQSKKKKHRRGRRKESSSEL